MVTKLINRELPNVSLIKVENSFAVLFMSLPLTDSVPTHSENSIAEHDSLQRALVK